jgi:cell division cycle protein 37
MITKNPKSIEMFTAQFRQTYEHVVKRSKVLSEEAEAESGDKEVIQLVAQDPNVKIGFNIPDGPPPEDLRIEGEGADQLDIEQVRAFLQHKWEIFSDFPLDLQEALKTEQLDAVNNVLEKMSVRDAEKVVEDLQEGGMLSFSEEGVRDMTQQ